jgi:uncharacterized protein with gpF-like domain
MPPVPGMPPTPGAAGAPQEIPIPEFGPQVAPQGGPSEGMTAALTAEAIAAQQATAMAGPRTKEEASGASSYISDEWDFKAEESSDRWIEILDASLERFFERQQRVIMEKAAGSKARKSIESKSLDPETIFDISVWNKQMNEDIRPILSGIMNDASSVVSQEASMQAEMDEDAVKEHLDSQMERMENVNSTTAAEVAAAVLVASSMSDGEDKVGMLKAALVAIFINLLMKRRRLIAEHEGQTAYNAGTYLSGRSIGAMTKTWITEKDPKVRPEHAGLHGKSVGVLEAFDMGGNLLRFPGDPFAPPHLTINCRCRLRFDKD